MDALNIYTLGSAGTWNHPFFDILNIKFENLNDCIKVFTNFYSYKGKNYNYNIFFISGDFFKPSLLPAGETDCDAFLFLINPFLIDVFEDLEKIIKKVAQTYQDTLIVLIMQNFFEELEGLDPIAQEIAISNGEAFCDLVTQYNILLFSLNYNSQDLDGITKGDLSLRSKFYKMFNDAFYAIIHECIERREDPEKKNPIITEEF
ncbi:MAG: hypothetical protein ACTSR8_07420 [Promethearchaeota archaeon]